MSWNIRIPGGQVVSSDDFLIEDLGSIEKATGESWAVLNPMRSSAVAKAFLAVAMLRSGRTEAEVETALQLVTLKKLKSAFTYIDDEEAEQEEVDPSVPSPSRTSGSSSHGSSTPGSRPVSRGRKGSATSPKS